VPEEAHQWIIGETIQIRTSEKVPLDGIVKNGTATIDESMLTGEPLPKTKNPDDHVFAGTMNQNGTIEVEVIKDGFCRKCNSLDKYITKSGS